MQNLDKVIKELKEIASKESIMDSLDEDCPFIVGDDYTAGNVDDAYWLGNDEGEISLARNILLDLGEDW